MFWGPDLDLALRTYDLFYMTFVPPRWLLTQLRQFKFQECIEIPYVLTVFCQLLLWHTIVCIIVMNIYANFNLATKNVDLSASNVHSIMHYYWHDHVRVNCVDDTSWMCPIDTGHFFHTSLTQCLVF